MKTWGVVIVVIIAAVVAVYLGTLGIAAYTVSNVSEDELKAAKDKADAAADQLQQNQTRLVVLRQRPRFVPVPIPQGQTMGQRTGWYRGA